MIVLLLQRLCYTCGYKGVIKKTKETQGFMCLCQGGFYGDRCQHEGKFTYLFIIILLLFLLLLQPSSYLYYHYYPQYYLTNRLHISVCVQCTVIDYMRWQRVKNKKGRDETKSASYCFPCLLLFLLLLTISLLHLLQLIIIKEVITIIKW